MLAVFSFPAGIAYHVLVFFLAGLGPLGVLAAPGAIVAFTAVVRLLVLPFSYYAMRGQIAQARLAPQVRALRERFAGQPDRLRREITDLRRNEGTPVFSGCLPAIMQWPFLTIFYLVLRSPVVDGTRNALLAHRVLGVPLGAYWLGGAGIASVHGAVFSGVLALLAAAGWLSARAVRRWAPAGGSAEAAWVTGLAPFTTAAVAAFLPLAAGLYLLATTAWTLLERAVLHRLMPPA